MKRTILLPISLMACLFLNVACEGDKPQESSSTADVQSNTAKKPRPTKVKEVPPLAEIKGSKTLSTEERELAPFSVLDVTGAVNATIRSGEAQSVKITADDNLLPYVMTEVEEGTLSLEPSQPISPSQNINVEITLKDLSALEIHGAGQYSIQNISNKALGLQLNGAALLDVDGTTESLSISLEGAGKINAKALKAGDADVSLNGAGHISLTASNKLNATVEGIGQVVYYGNPAEVEQNVEGLGSVKKGEE